jgi:hypothetical protein
MYRSQTNSPLVDLHVAVVVKPCSSKIAMYFSFLLSLHVPAASQIEFFSAKETNVDLQLLCTPRPRPTTP